MSCSNVKNVVFYFSFLIVVCGITLITLGAIILINESKGEGLDSFTDFSAGGFAIAVGLIAFCIAFFGCCGAIKENKCMLTSYKGGLIVLLILQIVLGSLAFLQLESQDWDMKHELYRVVNDIFQKYREHPTNDNKEVVDNIQQHFKCCGIVGPIDWHIQNQTPPSSCHKDDDLKGTLYKKGCAPAIHSATVYNIRTTAIVAIVYAVLEFFGALLCFVYF